MYSDALEQFCQLVLRNQDLQRQLRETPDQRAFTERMLALGVAHGFLFSAAEIEARLRAARQAWLERWATL
jgi:hypothetical protein